MIIEDTKSGTNSQNGSDNNLEDSNSQSSPSSTSKEQIEEVWVQNKAGDGKFYYYNARTRETSWTKPMNARIITQEEIEQMAAKQQPNKIESRPESSDLNQDIKVNNDNEPTKTQTKTDQFGSSTSSSSTSTFFPPPGVMPPGFSPFMPPPSMLGMPPPGMFPPGFPPGPGPTPFPPFGVPPFGGLPPPFGMMPPPFGAFAKPLTIDEKMKELKGLYDEETFKQIREAEEQLQKANDETLAYTEHETPEGKKYYYNTKTNESTWDKPKCFASIPELKAKIETLKKKKLEKPVKSEQKIEELSEEEKAKQKSKPVSSTAVQGTPWCVVWTRDGKVFFYNPSEHISLWERPAILKGRADVDKLVSEPPKEVEKKSTTTTSTTSGTQQQQQQQQPQTQQQQPAVTKKKLSNDSLATMTNENNNDEPPQKKNKVGSADADSGADASSSPMIQDENSCDSHKSTGSGDGTGASGQSKTIEASKEAAIEAELKAARERAQIPLEQRIKMFKELLIEKQVSAFSTWEKELKKVVFDSRYLLLTSKERKQVFEKYIKERADEERKEKAVALKQKRDEFRDLLKEAQVTTKTNFPDFATKYSRDERFKAIEKMKERESLFNDYQADIRKKEKEDKYSEKEKLKKDYLQMLKEFKHLNRHSSWSETKKQLESDSRYKAVESSSKREDWFRDYVRTLDSGDTNNTSKHDSDDEGEIDESKEEREKQERIEASLKEREKEVKEQLSKFQNEREKGREQLKREEALECFKALLTDLCKHIDSTWKETKKSLKHDQRWSFCKALSKSEKEDLFYEHIKQLRSKKIDQFYALLDETNGVTLSSTWKEVKKLIKADPRYEKLSQLGSDLKLDKQFENYIADKYKKAKADFKELLADTKLITYKTYTMIKESSQHLKEIEDLLSKDKCYLVLECAAEERKKMLMDYIEQLDKEGPPPPPTATEPNRRK